MHGQLGFCSGNSGAPIFTESFGSGTNNNALPGGTTTYNFTSGYPNDGFYTVSNGTSGNSFDWHQTPDHTGDTNGKCLIVNAAAGAGEFYKTTISGLCENTTYEFSSWVLNLVRAGSFCSGQPGGTIPINVRFEIWDSSDTSLLASGNTGNIVETFTPNWQEFGLVFQTLSGQNEVVLKMINNGQGGCGNDLAIDDIEFKTCGDLTIVQDSANNNGVIICGNQTPYSTSITAIPDNSVFLTHFYQWQESNDGIVWTDLSGETNQNLNISGLTNTSYYRSKVSESSLTVNNPQCNTLSDIYTVTVNPIITSTFNQVPPICSGNPLNPLPTTSNEGITGVWSPALDNTITTTYTFTPDAGQCASIQTMLITVNPIITPTFTQVSPICIGDVLNPLPTTSNEGITGVWSPALDNMVTTTYTFTPDSGQCAVNQTMSILVNPIVTPTFTQVPPICNGDSLSPLPITSNEGITGIWSPALDNMVTTTYTFTPDSGQCAVNQTMSILVNPIVTPTFTQVSPICSGDILNPLPTTSIEGITGVWSPALDNFATTTYTFTPDIGQCAVNQTMSISVNPFVIPTFTQVSPICNGDVLNPLPITSNEGITGVWSPVLNNTITATYTFTPDSGQCANIQMMTITVNPIQAPNFDPIPPVCSGEILSPLPTISLNGISGTWSPELDNTATTTYTFTPDPGFCPSPVTLTIAVNDNPIFSLQEEYFLCFEQSGNIAFPTIIDSGLNSTTYNFTWLLNGLQIPGANQGTYSPIESGNYEVIAQHNITGCSSTEATIVVPLYEPDFEARVTTDAFSKNQTIEVITQSAGVFEYQLDNNSWQDESFFYNVNIGEHNIKVRDKRGCIESNETLVVMGYPKFFTPNNDGFNDTWNIVAPTSPIDYLATARVFIYNRYGKLLKELNPSGAGWKGIYNGVTMPNDDYWFTVEYNEPNTGARKQFKAHFSLKR
jgi:gliding motility-associated-like protein